MSLFAVRTESEHMDSRLEEQCPILFLPLSAKLLDDLWRQAFVLLSSWATRSATSPLVLSCLVLRRFLRIFLSMCSRN